MIIWRPSANRNRFAYSLVNDLDQEEEEGDGMENKNFGGQIKFVLFTHRIFVGHKSFILVAKILCLGFKFLWVGLKFY